MKKEMKNTKQNQKGFIPMMILLLAIIVAAVYFVFKHVAEANK
jgi:hypothetical protein